MNEKCDLLEKVVLLRNELDIAVSHNTSLSMEQLIELSHKIDDLVIRLSK